MATAGPAERLLLAEVNGPWGRDALRDSRFDHYLAGRLQDIADAAGVRLVLIRRPGRHAVTHGALPAVRFAAVADLRPGHEAVQWYQLHERRELLEINLAGQVSAYGPQQVALVCTHGRHDVCCALRGRPVAAALVAHAPWDVWECSHLGGDRFAPNLLLLPDGDLYGGLDAASARRVLDLQASGRLDPHHHRGRFGRPPVEQAALHHAGLWWGETRRRALRVARLDREDDHRWAVRVERAQADGSGRGLRLVLVSRWSDPMRLTCQGPRPGRVLTYHVEAASEVPVAEQVQVPEHAKGPHHP